MSESEICKFFKHQTVFVTGGTGFLGKVLIEKLLRVCDPKKIYVLIRPKKDKTVEDRVDDFFSYPCFDRIKDENKITKEKIHFVAGDCTAIGLGLSEEDEAALTDETTVVIHAAAQVKFARPLREAARNNVGGTISVLTLAKKMKLLKSFVFVSTAYSNCIHRDINEEFYPPPMSYEQLFSILDGTDDDTLEAITPTLLGKWPNTYTYTKAIAEDAVKTLGKGLSVAMVRPAVVVNAFEEPVPGWIDNFYGVCGAILAVALGIVRSLHVKLNLEIHLVPVDYVSNMVLATSWNIRERNDIVIYNFGGHKKNLLIWNQFMKHLQSIFPLFATTKLVWHCSCFVQESKLQHDVCVFFLHTVPAYVIDGVLFCLGKQRVAVQGYKRLNKSIDLLSYFSTRTWNINDDNLMQLWNKMGGSDRKLFKFDMEDMNWNEYLYNFAFGLRLYLLKDTPDTIPKGKRKVKMMRIAHYTLVILFWFLLVKLVLFVLTHFL